jgi:hypothetical protein
VCVCVCVQPGSIESPLLQPTSILLMSTVCRCWTWGVWGKLKRTCMHYMYALRVSRVSHVLWLTYYSCVCVCVCVGIVNSRLCLSLILYLTSTLWVNCIALYCTVLYCAAQAVSRAVQCSDVVWCDVMWCDVMWCDVMCVYGKHSISLMSLLHVYVCVCRSWLAWALTWVWCHWVHSRLCHIPLEYMSHVRTIRLLVTKMNDTSRCVWCYTMMLCVVMYIYREWRGVHVWSILFPSISEYGHDVLHDGNRYR